MVRVLFIFWPGISFLSKSSLEQKEKSQGKSWESQGLPCLFDNYVKGRIDKNRCFSGGKRRQY
jgi:hypothetical protein